MSASAQPTVAAFIGGLIVGHHDSEDVLQRAAAVRCYEKYDPARPFVAWAIGLARIEVMRFRQERGRDRLTFDDKAVGRVASLFEADTPKAVLIATHRGRVAIRRCMEERLDRWGRASCSQRGLNRTHAAGIERHRAGSLA